MSRSRASRAILGLLFTASLAVFLYGCGNAPTAVEMNQDAVQMLDNPDPPADGTGDDWW